MEADHQGAPTGGSSPEDLEQRPEEAGIRVWEVESDQDHRDTDGGIPEEEEGTSLGLRRLGQGDEGGLTGGERTGGLCSCKACPMIYSPLCVTDGAVSVLVDVRASEVEGGQ